MTTDITTTTADLTDAQKVADASKRWASLKASAAQVREDWRAIGEALTIGRKLHPANIAFGKWCAEKGFDMDARVRSDAMWLHANCTSVFHGVEDDNAHPTHIRIAFNAKLKAAVEAEFGNEGDTTPVPAKPTAIMATGPGMRRPSAMVPVPAVKPTTPATTDEADAPVGPSTVSQDSKVNVPGEAPPKIETFTRTPVNNRPDPATYVSHWPAETLAISTLMVATTLNSHKDRDDASCAADLALFLKKEGCKVETLAKLQRVLAQILKTY